MAEAARSSRRRAGAEQHAHRVAVLGLEFLHGRCLLDRIALRRDQAQTDLPVLARKCMACAGTCTVAPWGASPPTRPACGRSTPPSTCSCRGRASLRCLIWNSGCTGDVMWCCQPLKEGTAALQFASVARVIHIRSIVAGAFLSDVI